MTMEFDGKRIIKLERNVVWENLNNPDVLFACIPGCQTLSGSIDEGFNATIVQKIGPFSIKINALVTFQNVVPNKSYTIFGEGKGGLAGFAKGSSSVTLADIPEGTELSYLATASMGGRLANLGSSIVGGFAHKIADQFFERFQSEVESRS